VLVYHTSLMGGGGGALLLLQQQMINTCCCCLVALLCLLLQLHEAGHGSVPLHPISSTLALLDKHV
jgi:hypothetical protein